MLFFGLPKIDLVEVCVATSFTAFIDKCGYFWVGLLQSAPNCVQMLREANSKNTTSRISINSLYSTYLHTHGTQFTPEFWQRHHGSKMPNTSCAPKTTWRGHAAHYRQKMAAGALSAVNVWTKAQLELSHITCSKLPGADPWSAAYGSFDSFEITSCHAQSGAFNWTFVLCMCLSFVTAETKFKKLKQKKSFLICLLVIILQWSCCSKR